MQLLTIAFGFAFILLGLGGYYVSGAHSPTALIPLWLGLILALTGQLAKKPERRKLWMHVAVTVGLLAFLGGLMGVPKLLKLLGGGEVARPLAAWQQSILCVLAVAYLVPCIRSFIAARRSGALG